MLLTPVCDFIDKVVLGIFFSYRYRNSLRWLYSTAVDDVKRTTMYPKVRTIRRRPSVHTRVDGSEMNELALFCDREATIDDDKEGATYNIPSLHVRFYNMNKVNSFVFYTKNFTVKKNKIINTAASARSNDGRFHNRRD